MEQPLMNASQGTSSPESATLQVDFTWKKFRAFIADKADPAKPLYILEFKSFKPHLIFLHADTPDKSFATGTLHAVSINADCTINGRDIPIKALKKFETAYTHLSHTFSPTGEPVHLTWTSSSSFKNWDFICLDPNQLPVARFSANYWAMKKIGHIEFMGAGVVANKAFREEIVVTGLTLFYCMLLRSSSIVSFFGAVFARPSHDEDVKAVLGKDHGARAAQKADAQRGEAEGAGEVTAIAKPHV